MAHQTLSPVLENILATHGEPDVVFSALLPALGEVLQCDRCFLYLRDPQTQIGKIAFCWRRSDRFPDVIDPDWKGDFTTLCLRAA